MNNGRHVRLGDRVVRRPRQSELAPVRIRSHHRRKLILPPALSSSLIVVLGFGALIAAGTGLLMLPWATATGDSPPILTALFTSTSATCVTGLVVVHTADYWSVFGETVVAGLMFLGGLGITTAGVVALASLGRRITLSDELIARETITGSTLGTVARLSRYIVAYAAVVQVVGGAMLSLRLMPDFSPGHAVGIGMFHSVAGFNNAGFSNIPGTDNLTAYQDDPVFLGIVGALIILGGISLPVVNEVARRRRMSRWSLDTRLVLIGSAVLWVAGAIAMLLFESGNPGTFGGMPLGERLSNALFHSVSARTAGFNAVDFTQVRDGTALVFILLMFIGGASGSTAGGMKVNTAMVLIAAVFAAIRGRPRTELYMREVPSPQVMRAMAVFLLAALTLFVSTLLLTATEAGSLDDGTISLLDLLFEVASAFGTVGLSLGVTAKLDDLSQYLIIATMYIGRLGPLTFAVVLALHERRAIYRFPQENVRLG